MGRSRQEVAVARGGAGFRSQPPPLYLPVFGQLNRPDLYLPTRWALRVESTETGPSCHQSRLRRELVPEDRRGKQPPLQSEGHRLLGQPVPRGHDGAEARRPERCAPLDGAAPAACLPGF